MGSSILYIYIYIYIQVYRSGSPGHILGVRGWDDLDEAAIVAGNRTIFSAHGILAKHTGKNRIPVQCVVHDLADEKNGREREVQQHAFAS